MESSAGLWRREWGTAKDETEAALDFPETPPRRPFFFFLHYFDAHSDTDRLPYDTDEDELVAVAGMHESRFEGCGESGVCVTRDLYGFGPCSNERDPGQMDPAHVRDIAPITTPAYGIWIASSAGCFGSALSSSG